MLTALIVEARKLNRSLALLLAVAAPCLIGVFIFFNMLRGKAPMAWEMWMGSSAGIWAFFMLPMSVTALTALVAHMEHGPKAWDHLRALPRPRWTTYAAKAACVLLLVAAMSLLNLAVTWGAVRAAATIKPVLEPTGDLALMQHLTVVGRMWLAAILLTVRQLRARPRDRHRRHLLLRRRDGGRGGRLLPLADAGEHAGDRGVARECGPRSGWRAGGPGPDPRREPPQRAGGQVTGITSPSPIRPARSRPATTGCSSARPSSRSA
jgi:hypothetical protein